MESPWPGIQSTFTERLKVQDFPVDKRFDLAKFQEEFQEELLNKLQEALIWSYVGWWLSHQKEIWLGGLAWTSKSWQRNIGVSSHEQTPGNPLRMAWWARLVFISSLRAWLEVGPYGELAIQRARDPEIQKHMSSRSWDPQHPLPRHDSTEPWLIWTLGKCKCKINP